MNQDAKDIIEHLSIRPWSEYTSADYTIQQWHNSCLIHQHTGAPASKNQCKLPVKTPSGALNKNGVMAAAAALAGARGGVHASSSEKSSASKALIRYYHQINAQPPPSLMRHSSVQEFIEHHGVKGMHWGVRRSGGSRPSGGGSKTSRGSARTVYGKHPAHLTSAELDKRIKRMESEKKYNELNKKDVSRGHRIASEILTNSGRAVASTVLTGALLYGIKVAVSKRFGHDVGNVITKRK
jgi:hypothetical protein